MQVSNDISVVDVDRHQGAQRLAAELRQVAPHKIHEAGQLHRRLFDVVLHLSVVDCACNLLGPIDVVDGDDGLPGPLQDPLGSVALGVVDQALARDLREAINHGVLDLHQPHLHVALFLALRHVHRQVKFHDFTFNGDHCFNDLILRVEANIADALKALAHVRLNRCRILGLRQNHQQLVVGQEEESGERQPFCLQVVVQVLLDGIQLLVRICEARKQVLDVGYIQDVRVLIHRVHGSTPKHVDLLEALRFIWHLPLDVVRPEDWLEVQPRSLNHQPLLKQVLDVQQLDFPILDLFLNRLDKRRTANRLRLNDVLIQQSLDHVSALDHEGSTFFVCHRLQLHRLPLFLHTSERCLQAVLLLSLRADPLHNFDVVGDINFQQLLQRQPFLHVHVAIQLVKEQTEMHGLEGFLAKGANHRHVRAELLYVVSQRLGDELGVLLTFELLDRLVALLELLLDDGIDFGRVELRQRAVQPILRGMLELNRRGPQLEIRLKSFMHDIELGIIRYLHPEQLLTVFVRMHALLCSVQVVLQGVDSVGVLRGERVLLQALDPTQLLLILHHISVELHLLAFQLVHEPLLL
mmetsp:Transcript_131415/g.420604  ORF Transcript_131415/g.420604 Transcript_131415/m.420604 type:complete len:580 (+) Transcript_131415:436-2175(+)